MSYMSCPRCGLNIRIRASFLLPDCCPRCIVRAHAVVPMVRPGDRPSTAKAVDRLVEPVTPAAVASATARNSQPPPSPAPISTRPRDSEPAAPPDRVAPTVASSPTTDDRSLAEAPTPLDHRFINEWS